eukprot:2699255-Amphidinium_carterae.1
MCSFGSSLPPKSVTTAASDAFEASMRSEAAQVRWAIVVSNVLIFVLPKVPLPNESVKGLTPRAPAPVGIWSCAALHSVQLRKPDLDSAQRKPSLTPAGEGTVSQSTLHAFSNLDRVIPLYVKRAFAAKGCGRLAC